MDQKHFSVLLLVFVSFCFAGFVVYDIKANNRFEHVVKKEIKNWAWNNNWSSPIVDRKPEIEKPKEEQKRIIASSYEDALKKSGDLGRPILVVFEADWCGWCQKMKSETLTDSKVHEAMKHYVVVDVDTDRNPRVSSKFGVRALPAYVITNYKEQNLKSGIGYKDVNEFVDWLDNPNLYKQPTVKD